jgi:hypothetical protein
LTEALMARTEKEKAYFLHLQTMMLSHRSYYLYDPAAQVPREQRWRSDRNKMSDEEEHRLNTTEKADKVRHIAASLQHDLWS